MDLDPAAVEDVDPRGRGEGRLEAEGPQGREELLPILDAVAAGHRDHRAAGVAAGREPLHQHPVGLVGPQERRHEGQALDQQQLHGFSCTGAAGISSRTPTSPGG